MARGECSCGAVRYEIELEGEGGLGPVYVCHCSICRRSTGSQGIAVVVVAKERFRWLQGESEIAMWSKPACDWQTWFCRTCGAKLPGHNDALRMFVPAGGLTEGAEALRVAHHIWVGSKASWDEIGDDGQQHPEGIGS